MSPAADRFTQVVEFIDRSRAEVIGFAQHLVRARSVSGHHAERTVARVIADQAATLGLQVQLIAQAQQHPNVLVTLGERHRPALLFVGHTDTTPPGDLDQWHYPPFSGRIVNGRLYGRGAGDTKGGIAAALFAIAALRYAKVSGRILLAAVADEESGARSEFGLKYLLQSGHCDDATAAIYAYPGMRTIRNGHRGYLRFRITAHGQSVHTGSSAWEQRRKGRNAVTAMAEILTALERLDYPLVTDGPFRGRRVVITPGALVTGGTAINMVPDRCEAWVDVRLPAPCRPEELLSELRQVIERSASSRGVRVEIDSLSSVPAAAISANAPIVKILGEACLAVTGVRADVRVAGPANEGYMLIEHGIQTVCGFGPNAGNVHAANEFVEIDSLVTTATIYASAALSFLAASEASTELPNPPV